MYHGRFIRDSRSDNSGSASGSDHEPPRKRLHVGDYRDKSPTGKIPKRQWSPMNTDKKAIDKDTETFIEVNEHPVNDISMEFFYKPHTITLLVASVMAVMGFAFMRDEHDMERNVISGLMCSVFFFVIVSVLTFPNGPFTRPHPAVWRIIFGLSVLYLLVLQFLMFQNHKTIMALLHWLDPALAEFHIDMDKDYGTNCSDISIGRLREHLDVFAWGHLLGWAFKATLIRHMGILWTNSVLWEVTELAFAHLLPNFIECWWDALILDVLICNGIGIWIGMKMCKMLEMREYKWTSFKDIPSTTGKIKRIVLQFTPESFTSIRWLDPQSTGMRLAAVCQMVIYWQITELNTFFLKHIFAMPPGHFLVILRLTLLILFVAPSMRQYYSYVTDTRCKRMGTQAWVFIAVMVSEALLCFKNGRELFSHTQFVNILLWLLIQILLSVVFVYCCILWERAQQKRNKITNEEQEEAEDKKEDVDSKEKTQINLGSAMKRD